MDNYLLAETFGLIAHERGKPAVPTLDPNMMDLLGEGTPVEREWTPLLMAWVRGWTKARLLNEVGRAYEEK